MDFFDLTFSAAKRTLEFGCRSAAAFQDLSFAASSLCELFSWMRSLKF